MRAISARWLLLGACALLCTKAVAQCEVDVLPPPDPNVKLFGGIVSLDGNRAAIAEAAGVLGSIRMFAREAGVWSEEALIADPHREPRASFGIAFQLVGETLIVSAFESSIKAPGEGAVYVFSRSSGRWSLTQEIRPPVPAKYFGYSIAFDETTLVVGANLTPVPGQAGKGCVFVFSKVDGRWSPLQQTFAPTSPADTYFGKRVVLLGDRFYVSQYPTAVWEYQRTRDGWTLTHQFVPLPRSATLGYAESLAVADDLLVVGAKDSVVEGLSTGNATLYQRDFGQWDDGQMLAPPTDEGPVFFAGAACAIVGRTVLVGAPLANGGAPYSGRVFLFTEARGHWSRVGEVHPNEPIGGSSLGWSMSAQGDEVLIGRTFAPTFFTGFGQEDCNRNGEVDSCDIALGASSDVNANGVPDECELLADLDRDGDVNATDLAILLGQWGECAACSADLDADGEVGTDDLTALTSSWTTG